MAAYCGDRRRAPTSGATLIIGAMPIDGGRQSDESQHRDREAGEQLLLGERVELVGPRQRGRQGGTPLQ